MVKTIENNRRCGGLRELFRLELVAIARTLRERVGSRRVVDSVAMRLKPITEESL